MSNPLSENYKEESAPNIDLKGQQVFFLKL